MNYLFLIAIYSAMILSSSQVEKPKASTYQSSIELNTNKMELAFAVLESKCNVCHVKKNRMMIFTKENMRGFSDMINQQVFIKQRMPKGNKIKLSEADKTALKNWIDTLK